MYVHVCNTYTNIGSEDYTPNAGSLTFSPEDISKNVVVVIRDDNVTEYPERLFLTLSVPSTEEAWSWLSLEESPSLSPMMIVRRYNNYYTWVKEFFRH